MKNLLANKPLVLFIYVFISNSCNASDSSFNIGLANNSPHIPLPQLLQLDYRPPQALALNEDQQESPTRSSTR